MITSANVCTSKCWGSEWHMAFIQVYCINIVIQFILSCSFLDDILYLSPSKVGSLLTGLDQHWNIKIKFLSRFTENRITKHWVRVLFFKTKGHSKHTYQLKIDQGTLRLHKETFELHSVVTNLIHVVHLHMKIWAYLHRWWHQVKFLICQSGSRLLYSRDGWVSIQTSIFFFSVLLTIIIRRSICQK